MFHLIRILHGLGWDRCRLRNRHHLEQIRSAVTRVWPRQVWGYGLTVRSRRTALPPLNSGVRPQMRTQAKLSPYRWRTALRRHLPWFLIDLGIAGKGRDCEAAGGRHSWYNLDGVSSGCYHCKVVRQGCLWEGADA